MKTGIKENQKMTKKDWEELDEYWASDYEENYVKK